VPASSASSSAVCLPSPNAATTAPMDCLCACRTRCCSTRLRRRRRRRERLWLRRDHRSPRNRAPCPCRDLGGRFGWRTRKAVAVGTRARPSVVVLDIEGGAGGDELLDHERVARHRGRDERSESAEKSAAG
jgi:hypothetical protein